MPTISLSRFHQARALFFQGMASRLVSGFMLVAVLTVVGKGVSFVKDASVARWFGTSDPMDAFVLAFGFLGFAASVIGGGLPEAFLPFYARLKHQRGMRRAQRLAAQSLLLHAVSLAALALLLWIAAPAVIGLTARRFAPEKQAMAVVLMRQLLPFLMCYGMTHQLAIWLRADKHFALAASAPMLIPLTILAFLASGATMEHLVTGTVWGSLIHVGVLGWVVGKKLPTEPIWRRNLLRLPEPGVRLACQDALPYLLAGVVYSSASVVDQAMAAAALPAGAVSVLSYSDKLVGILLALTALPAGEVLFPYFADLVARQDWVGLRQQLGRSALLIGGLAIPASALLFLLAPWVVRTLFQHGAFTAEDTERVSAVLRIAVFQVPFYIVGTLCSRVAVSMQATRFILLLSFLTMTCNAGLNWPLLHLLGAPGIALSTVLVSALSCLMVTIYTLRQIHLHHTGAVVPRSHTGQGGAA